MIQVWTPDRGEIGDAEFFARVANLEYCSSIPFAPERVGVVGEISRRILADPFGRSQPQFVALAYWMRPASVERRKTEWLARDATGDDLIIARGVALHLPPTNVDTIFVYSWVMSFLAGNTNVVRLPSERNGALEWLIGLISAALVEAGQADEHLFCAFSRQGDILGTLSRMCDLRMIWGGDAKVEAVSRLPMRPDGLSIGFPNRTSAAMIASAAYRAQEDQGRDKIAQSLFNDVFWFDQMGCGSPRIIFWVGANGDEEMTDLADRLHRVAESRGHKAEAALAIAKLTTAYQMLAAGSVERVRKYSNALVIANALRSRERDFETPGGGYLNSIAIEDVEDVASWVRRDVQTITHFGIGRDDLVRLAGAIRTRGGYRLVPVGSALAFDEIWDGVPLLTHMTRRIVIRS